MLTIDNKPERMRWVFTKENIFERTRREGDCIVWTGCRRNPNGYGMYGSPVTYMHRKSYELFHGPIPAGMLVCHKCDNRPCLNPDHLFIGTAADNTRDMLAKGRGRFPGPTDPRHRRLSDSQVTQLRADAKDGMSRADLMAKYGVSSSAISNLITFRRRKLQHS